LLKKGTSPLAIRARAASRTLEQEVGANTRLRVQLDDAFVPWDKVPVADVAKDGTIHNYKDAKSGEPSSPILAAIVITPPRNSDLAAPPEWLRRMMCCARWELLRPDPPSAKHSATNTPKPKQMHNTVLAVALPTQSDDHQPSTLLGPTRYEIRADGQLARYWAARTGLEVLDVERDGGKGGGGRPRSGSASKSTLSRSPPDNEFEPSDLTPIDDPPISASPPEVTASIPIPRAAQGQRYPSSLQSNAQRKLYDPENDQTVLAERVHADSSDRDGSPSSSPSPQVKLLARPLRSGESPTSKPPSKQLRPVSASYPTPQSQGGSPQLRIQHRPRQEQRGEDRKERDYRSQKNPAKKEDQLPPKPPPQMKVLRVLARGEKLDAD
jgi:hypothetical protein